MKPSFWLEKRREARLHAFGLALGLALAIGFHLAVLWGTRVDYRPALENARIRRVLLARPYRPAPPPPPPKPTPKPSAGTGAGADRLSSSPLPAKSSQPSDDETSARGTEAVGGERFQRGVVEKERGQEGAPVAQEANADAEVGSPPPPPPDEWELVLAELQARGKSLRAQGAAGDDLFASAAGAARKATGVGGTAGEGEEGFLDPRIRMNVVSYPSTTIDAAYPPIPYPDLRFQKRELQAGICRVYYRVWVDGAGRIVRRQIKTPTTAAERERYAAFVEAVTANVDTWPFERVEAEVHVDVLFEIE